jgi:glycosyltransferase involved in cell wall biosynthesis
MKVSVIIPVFNEEESLPELYQELRALFDSEPWEGEAIMVDDGSSDRSASVIARLA